MTDGTPESATSTRKPTTTGPAVSVCIPLYMKEQYIAETIRTILAQTFMNFEILILDNAGSDRSAAIASSFDDPRIVMFRNEQTIPGAENFAKVVTLGTAPLVKIVSADDVLYPTLLERQVRIMDDPSIAVVSCRHNTVDEHGTVINRDRGLRHPHLQGRRGRATVLRRVVRHCGNPVGNDVNLMFRRRDYELAGGMPDVPWIAQDVGLAVDLLRYGDFYGMPETLCAFRVATGSASAGASREGILEQGRFIDQLKHRNPEIVRASDSAFGRIRMPLMRARHRVIVDAAGPRGSLRQRTATTLLGLSRPKS